MQRIPQLDSLRALAILAVFLNHALHLKMLWMGVDLFFILSGFLITGVLLNAKHRPLGGYLAYFYARRARRLTAPYAMLLTLVSLVVGLAWTRHWYLYIVLTNLLEPLHIPHPAAFSPLWSLAVEEQFYLLWPFAVYFLNERRLCRLCVVLIVAAAVLRGALHFSDYLPIYTLTPFRMDMLATGALVCLAWRSHRDAIERWGGGAGVVLGVIGMTGIGLLVHLGISTGANTRIGNVLIFESSLSICLGIMLYALGGRGVGWLRTRPLMYIGKISYSMYLAHAGIILLVETRLHGMLAAVVALGLTIAYAALSWRAVETPLLRGKSPRAELQMERA
jgi:peptidoglycan/LPS O-acetylase OafA/YrhL